MIKFLLSVFCTFFITVTIHAQQYEIQGTLQDTMNVRPVVYASIALIRKSDSILIKHTRSNQQGKFSFKIADSGQYIILIAHSTFADYVDDITLSKNEKVDLGTIAMIQRGQMLREVIIKNTAAIKVKGDTLEYLADSFKVKEGAMVEDLLKVLPGIQVNKKGEITAMGEKVQKVLVDGEEFFGDDPTIATQNIQSKVVEKVQVFDKKSDQAQFTGFDDGQEEKTINLKLKDNMNRGQFGKIELGAGLDDRWQNQVMINSFKNKRQISAYGLMSSNGKTGLGWNERQQYTGAEGPTMSDEGFMWTMNSDDDDIDWGGRRGQEGITHAYVGGAHYANKWNEGKHHLNTNYSFGQINRTKKENSFKENILPNGKFYTNDTSESNSTNNTHRISGRYNWTVDSSLNIIYNLNSRIAMNESNNYNNTRNRNNEETPISNSERNITNQSNTIRVSNTLTVNKKLKKVGRTVSLSANYVYNNNTGDGLQTGLNQFINNGTSNDQYLDQKRKQEQQRNNLSTDITYTEPLTKKIQLKSTYAFSSDINKSVNNTLVKTALNPQEYTERVDSLSNEFDSKINSHTVGLELKYNYKKILVTAGSRVRYSIFDQKDLVRNLQYNYNRVNLFPNMLFRYKFSQFETFSLSYSGNTTQPSITQLQPVQNNSNPLEIYVGNPNLKIGFNQSFNLNYFSYKVLTSRSIYSGITFSNYYNNIALNRTVDEYGRSINQYVNLQGGYNSNFWGGYDAKIAKTDFNAGFNIGGNFSHSPNIINNITGYTNTLSFNFTPRLAYNLEEKINASINLGTSYSNTTNTIQTARNIKFFTFTPSLEFNYNLPYDLELNTDFDYQYTPAVGPYNTVFTRFIWNAYVGYRMLKKKTLQLRFSAYDMLNQNRGFDRTTTYNSNTERNYLTLSRYFMLSAIWNFSTGPMAANNSPAPSGMRMRRMPGGSGGRRRY